MTHVQATNLHFAHGSRPVLHGVDLALEPGTVTLLAGRNGSGKSTMLEILAGVRKPARGGVAIDGVPIDSLGASRRARTVTLVSQDADSSFEFTVRETVRMGRHPHISRFSAPSAEDEAAVDEALVWTDAEEFADRSVRTLSGGELRRIHIARALATQAPVLLLDEPTANLDLEHALAILELLRKLAGAGRTVVISSHDLNQTAPACDAVALLHDGRVFRSGAPTDVLDASTIRTVFGVLSDAPSSYFPREFRSVPGTGSGP